LIDEAMQALNQAEKIDPQTAAKDAQFPKLKGVVVEAIAERDAKAKEKADAAEKNKKGKS
jgi:hypothetical protein